MTAKRRSKPTEDAPRKPVSQPVNQTSGNSQVEIVVSGLAETPVLGLPIMREDFVTSTGLLYTE